MTTQTQRHPLLAELPQELVIRSRGDRTDGMRAIIDALALETRGTTPGHDALTAALLDALFVPLLRDWFARQPPMAEGAGWAAALRDPSTRAALDAIHTRYAESLTISDLSSGAGVSRATVTRRFPLSSDSRRTPISRGGG